MTECPETIYRHPDDYDLEHIGDAADIDFFVGLLKRYRPARLLELACGNGRVTIPLVQASIETGTRVVGIELVQQMLSAARDRRKALSKPLRDRLALVQGDMRTWVAPELFDLIVVPCSSVCHLLTLEDQVSAWRCTHQNLNAGGRFVVDVTMADLRGFAESFRSPAREIVEIDRDSYDAPTRTRMIRYRTVRYSANEQRASIRYLYDKMVDGGQPERSISDYESHVYYPRELELLFRLTGFRVEWVYGDYHHGALRGDSRQMLFCGVKL